MARKWKDLFTGWMARHDERRQRRALAERLRRLDDRMLRDIGIARALVEEAIDGVDPGPALTPCGAPAPGRRPAAPLRRASSVGRAAFG